MLTLHGYWRSSASYRVRIALAMKGVPYRNAPVNLRNGEQGDDAHALRNPQKFVPVLELEDGTLLTQSLAILDYLDATYREPKLMPSDAVLRSKILSAALVVAADTAPIQNLKVLNYIRAEHDQDDAGVKAWAAHWINEGFKSLEAMVSPDTAYFLTDAPAFFECCLVPQVYNARRFGVDMTAYPRLNAIAERCESLPAFMAAKPENQADAP